MERKVKKLSANKLAEYIDAKAVRRASLVKQQIENTGHPTHYYALAQSAARKVLASSSPEGSLKTELKKMGKHPGWGLYPAKLIENNLTALQGFWNASDGGLFGSNNTIFRKPRHNPDRLSINDVQVSNRFDLEALKDSPKGLSYGAVKFYFNKKHPLTDLSGNVLAALLYNAAVDAYGESNVDRKSVLVVDTFDQKVYRPKPSTKKLLAEVYAAAKEFGLHWDSLIAH